MRRLADMSVLYQLPAAIAVAAAVARVVAKSCVALRYVA